MKALTRYGLLAVLALSVTGCGTVVHTRFENHCGRDLLVQTKLGYRNPGFECVGRIDRVSVPAGQSADLFLEGLSEKDVLLLTPSNSPPWRYTMTSHGNFHTPAAFVKSYRFQDFPLNSVYRVFLVNDTGRIYALPARWFGWDRRNYREKQPPGFPLVPERTETK